MANELKRVVLSGGFTYEYDEWFGNSTLNVNTIIEGFKNAGWSVNNITATQNGATIGITIDVNVLPEYSAEQARTSAIALLSEFTTGVWLSSAHAYRNVFMQIVSDGSRQISKNVEKDAAAMGGRSGVQVIGDAAVKSYEQVNKDGFIPTGTDAVSSFLFGEPLDVFGYKIPKIYIVGGIAAYLLSGGGSNGGGGSTNIYTTAAKTARRMI